MAVFDKTEPLPTSVPFRFEESGRENWQIRGSRLTAVWSTKVGDLTELIILKGVWYFGDSITDFFVIQL